MKIVLLNIDKFVAANNLQEITNPIVLERGFVPSPDGLLSTEIFGTNTTDRRQTFAYIDLHCHVLHPLVYKTLKRMDRRIEEIIAGTKYFKIDKEGSLVEDEAGDTGSEWLYANWSKIKWKRNDSAIRSERIDFLENCTKDELFQSKEIVCPAFYRDVNLQSSKSGRPAIHKINRPYSKLIRLASALDNGDFAFNLNYTRFSIQETLVEIYDEFKARVEKKRGLIKQSILGKSIDYGARVVISAANFTFNSVEEMPVDFLHAGVPLSYCIALFTPFFTGWIQNFFGTELEALHMKYPIHVKKTGEIRYITLKDPKLQFTDEKIKELMNEYIHSYSTRFRPIEIETMDKEYPTIKFNFKGILTGDKEVDFSDPKNILLQRPFTLTDLMYLAAVDICKDKMVYITRYPMADHLGIFPIGIHVLSTNKVQPCTIDDVDYKHYPVIDINMDPSDVPNKFTEVVQMSNVYLKAIGGDYDGHRKIAA